MSDLEYLAAFAVSVLAAARLTRLVTYDAFPPSAWLRAAWSRLTDDGPWSLLAYCAYCFSFWAMLLVLGTGWLVDWHPAWWLAAGALGGSYLAATYVAHDGEPDDPEESD